MATTFQLLYPPEYDRTSEILMKDYKFIHSLQIDDMIVLIKESYRGFKDLSLENFFTTDERVLAYRLSVVQDIVDNESLYQVFCDSISMIHNIHDLHRAMSSDFSVESALNSIRYLEMYEEIVDLFANGLKNLSLQSEGMQSFRKQILDISESEEYRNLKTELAEADIRFGNIKGLTIGVNLDETLRVKEAGVISVEDKPFHAGTVMEKLLRRNPKDTNSLISPLFPLGKGLHGEELKALNYSVQSALNTIYMKLYIFLHNEL